MSTDWMTSAPCASADPDAWFPEDGDVPREAQRICATCPYKAPCALGAIERGERHGVWGGYTYRGLLKLRRELDGPVRLADAPAMRRALERAFADDEAGAA